MAARVQEYLSSVPIVTRCLLIINLSIHALIFLFTFPIGDLAINPVLVVYRGEYYRIVSSAFTHGGFMHILMNMSSLIPLGTSLESQFGSLRFLLITLWSVVMCGIIFCLENWIYSLVMMDPGLMRNNAVGFSGVLFCYALIESFHSLEQSRSVFGLFSVPTKSYPIILLVILQIVIPNISLFGHLAGLLFGIVIISRIGVTLFMPSAEGLQYMDQMACLGWCNRLSSYARTTDKDLVHSSLESHRAGNACSMCTDTVKLVLGLIWNAIYTLLYIVGFPTDRLINCICESYKNAMQYLYNSCVTLTSIFGNRSGGVGSYEAVSTTDQDRSSISSSDATVNMPKGSGRVLGRGSTMV